MSDQTINVSYPTDMPSASDSAQVGSSAYDYNSTESSAHTKHSFETHESTTYANDGQTENTVLVSICDIDLPRNARVVTQLFSFNFQICLASTNVTSAEVDPVVSSIEQLTHDHLSIYFLTCDGLTATGTTFYVNALSSAPSDIVQSCELRENSIETNVTDIYANDQEQCCTIEGGLTARIYYLPFAKRKSFRLLNSEQLDESMDLTNATTTISDPAMITSFGAILKTIYSVDSPLLSNSTIRSMSFLGFRNGALSRGGFGRSGGTDSASLAGRDNRPSANSLQSGAQMSESARPSAGYIIGVLMISMSVIVLLVAVALSVRRMKRNRLNRKQQNSLQKLQENNSDEPDEEPDESDKFEEGNENGSISVLSDLKELELVLSSNKTGDSSMGFEVNAVDHYRSYRGQKQMTNKIERIS